MLAFVEATFHPKSPHTLPAIQAFDESLFLRTPDSEAPDQAIRIITLASQTYGTGIVIGVARDSHKSGGLGDDPFGHAQALTLADESGGEARCGAATLGTTTAELQGVVALLDCR